MGRRSTNTTKSGKFMNPTDQARKEARKKELKKNKKQRKLVRETVLKLKDPTQIVEEMFRLDMLEIEGLTDSVNDKVVGEKKKKLQETLTRILTLYEKSDQEKFAEIKKFQAECDRKRHKAYLAYQSQRVKEQEDAQRKREEEEATFQLSDVALPHSDVHTIPGSEITVNTESDDGEIFVPESMLKNHFNTSCLNKMLILKVFGKFFENTSKRKWDMLIGNLAMEEIPLPHQMMPGMMGITPTNIPMPGVSEHNIAHIPGLPPGLIPPGPPPGLPPPPSPEYDYGDDEPMPQASTAHNPMDDIDQLDEEFRQDIDHDGEEYYAHHSDDEREEKGGKRKRHVHFEDDDGDNVKDGEEEGDDLERMTMQKRLLKLAGHNPNQRVISDDVRMPSVSGVPGAPPGPPPGAPPRVLPPGPPPGRPPGPPPGLPPRPPPGGLPHMPMPPPRMPPGMPPPPGMRPWGPMGMYGGPRPPHLPGPQNVIEKGPEIKKVVDKDTNDPTISAKPQLRNIRAEVTKFVPTAVKIRRNQTSTKSKPQSKINLQNENTEMERTVQRQNTEPTKDAVYAKFMEQMTGFL